VVWLVGVRIAEAATRILDCDLRHPGVVVAPGRPTPASSTRSSVSTGATPGNQRLRCSEGRRYAVSSSEKEVVFRLLAAPQSVDDIFAAEETSLFECAVHNRPQPK